jgi:hypothetical protein
MKQRKTLTLGKIAFHRQRSKNDIFILERLKLEVLAKENFCR